MGFQLSYQLRMSSSEGWTGAGRPASKLTPEAAGGRLQSADYNVPHHTHPFTELLTTWPPASLRVTDPRKQEQLTTIDNAEALTT